ncbi:MAG: beta-galactosidase, partial [Mesotoga sp.]|nr:beta-galactosidase [Mesotoga sp.]
MKRVECRDGKFVIDGRERFLFSAEMHYFRVPADDWSDRLEKIRRAGFDTLSFYVPWFWHETKEGEIDFQGRTSPERDLTGFTRLAVEYGFDLIIKPGPYIMSELKNEGLPDWLYVKHPDGIALTGEGKPHPTRVFSYLHPGFLDCVREWYASVAKVIRESDAIMVQLDNEVGMLHWVTSTGDYSPVALDHFREYLTAGAPELLAELEAWSYGKQFAFPLNVEYHRFMRRYF